MTGGSVVVLGDVGINFGAGMTGGVAFVYDESAKFSDRYNHELVDMVRIDTEQSYREQDYLLKLLKEYSEKTQSIHGQNIIDNFSECISSFWLVKPKATELETLMITLMQAA